MIDRIKIKSEYEIQILTGLDIEKRVCDFCQQSNQDILIRGTNDDDRDICANCVVQFAKAVEEKLKDK